MSLNWRCLSQSISIFYIMGKIIVEEKNTPFTHSTMRVNDAICMQFQYAFYVCSLSMQFQYAVTRVAALET